MHCYLKSESGSSNLELQPTTRMICRGREFFVVVVVVVVVAVVCVLILNQSPLQIPNHVAVSVETTKTSTLTKL